MGDFFGFVNSILSNNAGVYSTLISLFQWLVQVMAILFNALWKALVDIANFLFNLLTKVGKLFRFLWDGFFKRIFTGLFNAILKAHDWLEAHLQPIIRFLQRIRAFVDRVLNRYVRPIMNMIQRMRQFLLILRLFHVKWAQQLDAKLVQIEVKMASVFIEARRILNGVIDAVNLVVDPTRLLKHPILIISIRRSLPAFSFATTGMPLEYWVGSSSLASKGGDHDCKASSFIDWILGQSKPSQFMGEDEGIPGLNFLSEDVEAAPEDVDSLDKLGMFASQHADHGGCTDVETALGNMRRALVDDLANAVLVATGQRYTFVMESQL